MSASERQARQCLYQSLESLQGTQVHCRSQHRRLLYTSRYTLHAKAQHYICYIFLRQDTLVPLHGCLNISHTTFAEVASAARCPSHGSVSGRWKIIHLKSGVGNLRGAQCVQIGGRQKTPAYLLNTLKPGHVIEGPAILIDDISTVVVEPECTANITAGQDIRIEVLCQPPAFFRRFLISSSL